MASHKHAAVFLGNRGFIPFALSLSKGIYLKIKDFDGFGKLTISPNGFELIRDFLGLCGFIFHHCAAAMPGDQLPPQSDPPISQAETLGKLVQIPAVQIPAAGIVAPASASPYRERLLLVDINRQQLDQTVLVLEDKAGTLYLWSKDLQRWRLLVPDVSSAITYQGEQYFPLKALAYVSHVYDPTELSLRIQVRPEAFVKSRLSTRYDSLPAPARPTPGGFINYDLFAAQSHDSKQRSGLFELGVFNAYGVGIGNVFADSVDGHLKVTRLDTSWTIDTPEKMRTLRLGDAMSLPGSWGNSVRFGGISYATNFATHPGFVTFPAQSIAGQALVPSTIDVFINNALVSRQNVQPGPFSIANLPVVTGAGEVQLVMRDVLGREQIITRPFYASQALLRAGLTSFSYEAGFVREDFGLVSNRYANWRGSGTYRRGLSDTLTGEVHAEAMPELATAGLGGDYLIPQLGTLSAYVAGSQGKNGNGTFSLLGIQRQAQAWSYSARTQWASRKFVQVGHAMSMPSAHQLNSASVSYAAGKAGSFSLAYIGQRYRDRPDVPDARIASLSYSVAIGRSASFTLSALRHLTAEVNTSNTTFFAMLSIPLDASTNLSISAQTVRGTGSTSVGKSNEFVTTLQKNLPPGEGGGYRLNARSDRSAQASLAWQNNVATAMIEAAQNQGVTATRLSVSGGVAFLGGDAFMSRRIDQSFAVARIPDYPNVRILSDNQAAGRTDANGNALIPRLRAYDLNVLSIDQRDLAMDAQISAVKLEVVPHFRSGVEAKFAIKRSHGATFTLHLDDGTAVPVGATVHEIGSTIMFPVGYDGQVYVTGLGAATRLRASWQKQSCECVVSFVASADPLPDLGTFICKGVTP